MLGVFLLPAFTRLGHECQDLLSSCDEMHVHRLDLGLHSHPREILGNGVRTYVNSMRKIPSTRGSEKSRSIDAASRRTASPTHYQLSYSGPYEIHVYVFWEYVGKDSPLPSLFVSFTFAPLSLTYSCVCRLYNSGGRRSPPASDPTPGPSWARMHHKVVGNFGSEADVRSLYFRGFRFNETSDNGACTHGRPGK